MDHLTDLRAAVAELGVVDSYQYVAGSGRPVGLPNDVRVIVRQRLASDLGSAVHDQFTLVVALAETGQVVIDGERLRLDAGTVLLIHPGQVHAYADLVDQPVHWLFFGFHHPDPAHWQDLRNRVLMLSPRVASDLTAILADHFFDIAHGKRHTVNSERQVVLRLELALEQLLAECRARATGSDVGEADLAHTFVQRVVAYVAAHLAEPLFTEGIARALNLSPGHLRNEFHRHAGMGIGRYIRTARIRHACVLLDTTTLDIAEIGRRCGYESIYSFSRAFRADKGLPPSTYRRNLRPVS